MIAKGNTHDDGARLARYITKGKDHESAELWELRGFALRDIIDAFRSVHVMASMGQCRQPFFHVQVRNLEGETLTRVQWNKAIDKIETVMGLVDQPRAIAAHTDLKTGHEHIHIAWSRIDPETLTARPLPFFKLRLKRVCRELEALFGLSPVPNERRDRIGYAPKRSEEQQSRRLGIVIHDVREAIKTCFENSDCGRSFKSALDAQGLLLAKGERRDFIILDQEGGLHAVGKRILGIPAAEIRTRLADLLINDLPTVEQARGFIAAAKQVSPDHKVDDFCKHSTGAPKPTSERQRARHGAVQTGARAVGKEERRDQVTKKLAVARAGFPLDYLVMEPQVPSGSLEGESAPIDQLHNEAPEPTRDTVQNSEVLSFITGLRGRAGELVSPDKTGGLQPEKGEMPQLEQTPHPQRASGYAARLRHQFRAVVKQLTAKIMEPQPTPRKRRREEIGEGFRKAALGLMRRIARVPPFHFLDPTFEPFTWLHILEYNLMASTDFHHNCAVSPPPEDISLRL